MKRTLKYAGILLLALILLVVLAAVCYVGYMQWQYHRIPDNTPLEVAQPQDTMLKIGQEYTAMSYNIGFGAYGPDYSFFMDKGVMEDGTPVKGKYGKAISADSVQQHTDGVLEVLGQHTPDFALLQEVDQDADRSYHINQQELIAQGMPGYASVYDINFHSAYLMYPFNDPHGAGTAGLLTLSRYAITDAVHRSYPAVEGFFAKFTDLDRCFTTLRVSVENGRELVILHSHMSAYDEGGTVRQRQLEMISSVMTTEYEKGNYVIVGGDFNHALGEEVAHAFPSKQQYPAWVYVLDNKDLPEHFELARAHNRTEVSTCRAAEIVYEPGVNYCTVLDGFWVSDNIQYTAENIDTQYANSDHNPVLLHFTLKD